MKNSYFLKCIGLLVLTSGIGSAKYTDDFILKPAYGLHVTQKNPHPGDVTEDLRADATSGNPQNALGILIDSGQSIGDVTSTITSSNINGAYAWGIYLEDGATMGTVSGTIATDSNLCTSVGYLGGTMDHYDAIGLFAEKTGDSTGIDVDWSSVNFNIKRAGIGGTGTVRAIYLNAPCANINDTIDGSIKSTTDNNDISGDAIAIDLEGTSIAALGSHSSVEATVDYDGNAYGLKLTEGASIGDLKGKITASSRNNSATAIYLDNSIIGTISGTVQAKNAKDISRATAIDYNTNQQLVLDGATIKAYNKNLDHPYGTAIRNTTHGISMASIGCSDAATISGNLDAGDKAIQFESGDFVASGDSWKGSAISIGSDGSNSTVTLASDLGIDAGTLDFYINGLDSVSSIKIGDGFTLDLSSVNTINVYLEDSVMESGDFDLTLMDGEIACMSPNIQVNYILGEGYTDEFLSYGPADDGTSFIVSQHGGGGDIPSVPEPTTASLSLLALAALAARRRRKV